MGRKHYVRHTSGGLVVAYWFPKKVELCSVSRLKKQNGVLVGQIINKCEWVEFFVRLNSSQDKEDSPS